MAYRPIALFCVYPMRLRRGALGRRGGWPQDPSQTVGDETSFRNIHTAFRENATIKRYDRNIVSCWEAPWSMLPTRKNQCFLQVRNMISVSNDKKSSFFCSRKHDQCFESGKNIAKVMKMFQNDHKRPSHVRTHPFPPPTHWISKFSGPLYQHI